MIRRCRSVGERRMPPNCMGSGSGLETDESKAEGGASRCLEMDPRTRLRCSKHFSRRIASSTN